MQAFQWLQPSQEPQKKPLMYCVNTLSGQCDALWERYYKIWRSLIQWPCFLNFRWRNGLKQSSEIPVDFGLRIFMNFIFKGNPPSLLLSLLYFTSTTYDLRNFCSSKARPFLRNIFIHSLSCLAQQSLSLPSLHAQYARNPRLLTSKSKVPCSCLFYCSMFYCHVNVKFTTIATQQSNSPTLYLCLSSPQVYCSLSYSCHFSTVQ